MKFYFVYIMASRPRGTLYIGVTSDLVGRVYQHRNKSLDGFSSSYGTDMLVWYETHRDIKVAITREKQLKKWRRVWKIELVEEMNPEWSDLYEELV